jgi:hypothetical protein
MTSGLLEWNGIYRIWEEYLKSNGIYRIWEV